MVTNQIKERGNKNFIAQHKALLYQMLGVQIKQDDNKANRQPLPQGTLKHIGVTGCCQIGSLRNGRRCLDSLHLHPHLHGSASSERTSHVHLA